MAYYNKQEIRDYVNNSSKEMESRGVRPLNPVVEVMKRLDDEEDMVGFFWVDYSGTSQVGDKIKMEGKSWYRISHNIYTDDRFAIDLYQAMKAGLTVTDIISKRNIEKELAKQGIVDVKNLEDTFDKNISKDGD